MRHRVYCQMHALTARGCTLAWLDCLIEGINWMSSTCCAGLHVAASFDIILLSLFIAYMYFLICYLHPCVTLLFVRAFVKLIANRCCFSCALFTSHSNSYATRCARSCTLVTCRSVDRMGRPITVQARGTCARALVEATYHIQTHYYSC